MSFIAYSDDEKKALLQRLKEGCFFLALGNERQWGVYRCEGIICPRSANPLRWIVGVTAQNGDMWEAPHSEHYSPAFRSPEEWEPLDGCLADASCIRAIVETEDEARAIAEAVHALCQVYNAEIAQPLLKLQMGLRMVMDQAI